MDYRFLRLLLWVLPLWLAVTPAIGQDTPGDDSVRETNLSINLKDQSLQEALTLLHQLSGCNFLYDQSLADRVPRITLNMQNASLSEILDRIASITNLQYSRVDNTITFASKGGGSSPGTGLSGSRSAGREDLSGKVVDENGEPLAGATVLLVGSGNAYALTDLDGHWALTAALPARVSVSYLGYVTKEVRIDSGAPVTITLQEDMNMLDEIVVVGYGTMEKRAVTSSIT